MARETRYPQFGQIGRRLRNGLLLATLLLQACGGEGVEPERNAPPANAPVSTYNGPAPASSEVQAFRLSVWDSLSQDNRCGSCHSVDGGQEPLFARRDDVNLAFQAARPLIDESTPELSLLATKVGGGHNCWTSSDAACADIISRLISDWIGGATGGGGREIVLTAPVLKAVGTSRSFPQDSTGFTTHLHGLLTSFCADCHSETADLPQPPFFANADTESAYAAARTRINLDEPAQSRLVVRLREEFHNCWSGDCAADADSMQAAIANYAAGIAPTEVAPDLVVSRALRIVDGLVAAGASRHESDAIAIWEFKTGTGNVAFDTSGVDPALDLNLFETGWVGGWGIEFNSAGAKAQGSTAASRKLYEKILATGEYSIEAWVVPANVTQEGPARIISYSGSRDSRNFMLGQTLYNYDFLSRSSDSDANGEPALSTADAAEVLQATQQHVVVTYDPAQGRRIYVNGVFTGDADPLAAGGFEDWDDGFVMVLGNEVSGDRPWAGRIRMVAIHNRVLTDTQIAENFAAGVGQKFYLLFSIAAITGDADTYILFEVSQFDQYSYLFTQPTFVSLNTGSPPREVALRGLRIGINGKEAGIGQAYARLETTLGGSAYAAGGQRLSELGAVIALEKGPESDEFFLSFDQLDQREHLRVDGGTLISLAGPTAGESAQIGLRTFDEIDASMSSLTGVPRTTPDVVDTFTTIKQQLPSVESIDGFLSAHQVAIAQLAIEYCNALVEDTSLRAQLFPAFDFTASASAVDSATWNTQVIDPLIDRIVGINLADQPDPVDVRDEINALITRNPGGLAQCGDACPPERSATVVKAACSALLGSAVTLLQ